MYRIDFNKPYTVLEDNLIGIAVENVIRKNSSLIHKCEESGTLNDIQKGVFGLTNEIYVIKGEGTIHYQRFNISRKYVANIYLLGFNENSKTFKNLRRTLKEIASTNNIEVIKTKFLNKK